MERFDINLYYSKLEALYKRFPSVQNTDFNKAYKPGLEHIEAFSSLLGMPERDYKVIHIAGTNGKGSVANMLSSILSACGLKVGLYTSPHLLDFRERMRIIEGNGVARLVDREYVLKFINNWKSTFEKLDLSFFEITTGMAFKWFSEEDVDIAVIEVGLGGRLDSTNIVLPELSVITSIGMDHCHLLGNTLAEIAMEKAGIIKDNVPVVVGEMKNETKGIFEEKAHQFHTNILFADCIEPCLWNNKEDILANMDLQGAYQVKNLRTVLACVEVLKKNKILIKGNDEILADAIIHTAEKMDFHGRWEKLSDVPYTICDIGHNPPALENNFAQLLELKSKGGFSKLIIIYGVMADKDLDSIMPLMPENAKYIFTQPKSDRALNANKILEKYSAFCKLTDRYLDAVVTMSVEEALTLAKSLSDNKTLIYIGGSTFVVSEALPLWNKK